jgi:hypothetical protein
MRWMRKLVATAVAVVVLGVTTPAVAFADDGQLILDQSGANGAVTGAVEASTPGTARITAHNTNEFWTTIDLSTTGVALAPGPPLAGGIYARLGVIAPDETATWEATWNPRQAAQVFVRTTPYIAQTTTGGLAAALTVLTIIADGLPGAEKAGKVVAAAEALQGAATLVATLFGPNLAEEVSVEGLTSGRFAHALFDVLTDAQKLDVLREALGLFGVTVTPTTLGQLSRGWIPFVTLGLRALGLARALLTTTSSGGLLFSSAGTAALPPSTQPPSSSTRPPRPQPSSPPPSNSGGANPAAGSPVGGTPSGGGAPGQSGGSGGAPGSGDPGFVCIVGPGGSCSPNGSGGAGTNPPGAGSSPPTTSPKPTPAPSPHAPTGLTATAAGPTTIDLTWTEDGDPSSFEVNNGVASRGAPGSVRAAAWSGLSPGTYMCFRIRAVSSTGTSGWSPATSPYYVCATTPKPSVVAPPTSRPSTPSGGSSPGSDSTTPTFVCVVGANGKCNTG